MHTLLSKRLPVAAALMLPLSLCACTSQPCTFSDSISNQLPGLLLVGEPSSMFLRSLTGDTCEAKEALMPTGISVEVSDPDQQPVESHVELGVPVRGSATISFTPRKPGSHHVFAAFEPVGGIHQFEVHAAVDRSASASLHTLPRACPTLEHTRSGTWVCGLEALRDGVRVREFSSGRVAVSGDVVWKVDSLQVLRYVDTGTGLELTASMRHEEGATESLLATEEELVVLHPNKLQRITFDGTTLKPTGVSLWDTVSEPVNSRGPRAVLVRTGDRLAVISRVSSNGGARVRACPFQLDQGRFLRTTESCQELAGQVVGFEPSVLWLAEKANNQAFAQALNRLEWTGTQWVTRGTLFLTDDLQPSLSASLLRTSVVPVLESPPVSPSLPARGAVPVYLPEQSQLRLDSLDAEALQPLASPELFWGLSQTGGTALRTRIRLRPSTP
jgi:hypothetical protein